MSLRFLLCCWVGMSQLACATAGSSWIRERWDANTDAWDEDEPPPFTALPAPSEAPRSELATTRLAHPDHPYPKHGDSGRWLDATGEEKPFAPRRIETDPMANGRSLGSFRNTYYDFPSESDFRGKPVTIFDGQCKPISEVAGDFFETLCVQGSGLLASGKPVSFERRDCACAPTCPRTGQRICFESLDLTRFPWGRGASGKAITPLLTVAVDSDVIPLGSAVYIPEYDGLPRDAKRTTFHDGCFVAQDRGLKVKGQHVDVFTGLRSTTRLWNDLVPSNSGVTVILNHPRCARSDSTTVN